MKRLLALLLLLFKDGMNAEALPESPKLKFTQLQCENFDKSCGEFSVCKISYIQRQVDAVSITYNLRWNISRGLKLNYQLLKKESGWHPFLYGGDVHVCDFFRNRKRYPIPNLYYTLVENSTNVRHKCPFISGEQVSLNALKMDPVNMFSQFPVYIGEYGLETNWFFNKKRIARIFGAMTYTDYRSG